MSDRRVHVWIKGRVQRVAFRAYAQDEALRHGLTGWIRNLPDRRVEAVFQGDSDRVEQMLAWCRTGSPRSRVDEVEVWEESPSPDLKNFEIWY